MPHEPQFAGSLTRLALPLAQQDVPAPHVVPQAWQWRVSTGVQAPLQQSSPVHVAQEPPQWVGLLATHEPAQQTSPVPHGCPQLPQLSSSVCVSAHELPQHCCPTDRQFVAHIVHAGSPFGTHVPPQQDCAPVHAWPHVMQLA